MSVILPTYNPADHLPPPADLFPSLRIVRFNKGWRLRYRAYLSRSLTRRLGLAPDQPIDILPPSAGHPYWHLDLRPQAKRRINWYKHSRPRLSLDLPDTAMLGRESLTLCLVPGDPAFPGFYPLLPDAFFAPKH